MKDTSDRGAAAPAAAVSQSDISRMGRMIWGLAAMAVGGALACVMAGVVAVALFQKVLADDFFGISVAAMVVIFGMQLMKIGYDAFKGRQGTSIDPDPLEELWNSDRPVYPVLPRRRFKIWHR